MADDDHQEIIELVRRQLKENGMLDFTVLTLDEEGREGRIAIDPEFFRSDATKDRLKRDLRRDFRKKGIVRYALVAECWMGTMKPIPSAPETPRIISPASRRISPPWLYRRGA